MSKISFFGKTCRTEADLEKAFKARAKQYNMLAYKFSSPAKRGVPDMLVIYRGKTFFIEFKSPSNPSTGLSELQKIEIRRMQNSGAWVDVAYDCNDAERIFTEIQLTD